MGPLDINLHVVFNCASQGLTLDNRGKNITYWQEKWFYSQRRNIHVLEKVEIKAGVRITEPKN